MGFMTTVTILNDAMHEIERDPEGFVEGIVRNYNDGDEFGLGNHANGFTVMPTHHADDFRLYAAWRNSTIDLNVWNRRTQRIATTHPDVLRRFIKSARYMLDELEDSLPEE